MIRNARASTEHSVLYINSFVNAHLSFPDNDLNCFIPKKQIAKATKKAKIILIIFNQKVIDKIILAILNS